MFLHFSILFDTIWALVAGFIAIRQGLDINNFQTVVTIIIGIIAYVVMAICVGLVVGMVMVGTGAVS